jgi:hypothetical protein
MNQRWDQALSGQQRKGLPMTITQQPSANRVAIADAISRELERQGIAGADVEALADAVELSLSPHEAPSEGKRPEDLNSTNDD